MSKLIALAFLALALIGGGPTIASLESTPARRRTAVTMAVIDLMRQLLALASASLSSVWKGPDCRTCRWRRRRPRTAYRLNADSLTCAVAFMTSVVLTLSGLLSKG